MIPLSEVMSREPMAKKVNLNKCGITHIDRVNTAHPKIQQLHLKGNLIQRLQNISQFRQLRVLDLSDNKIEDQRELEHLKNLKKLEVVHVSGNPFLKQRLKNEILEMLQYYGCQLSPRTDKHEEELKIQKTLVENYTDLLYLQSIYRKAELHLELTERTPNIKNEEVSMKILIKLKNSIISLDDSDKYLHNLQLDAYSMVKTLKLPDIPAAYNNLIEKQNKKKRELLQQIQIKLKIFNEQNKKSNSPRKSPKKSENRSKSRNPSMKKRVPLSEQNLQALYYKNLTKHNPVYHLLYSPLHSLKPKQKDLLIQTLSAHLKEKSLEILRREEQNRQIQESFREQIAELQEQVTVLEEHKNQLARKLLEYETNIDFNIEISKNAARKTELVEARANGEMYREMYEKLKKGVEFMADVDKKAQDLLQRTQTRLLKKYLFKMKVQSQQLNIFKRRKVQKEQYQNRCLLMNCFDILKKNSLIKRVIKIRQQEGDILLKQISIMAIKNNLHFQRTARLYSKQINERIKKSTIAYLRQFCKAKTIQRLKNRKATSYHSLGSKSRIFKIFKADYVRSIALEPVNLRMEYYFQRKTLRKVWMKWTQIHQKDKIDRIRIVQAVREMQIRRYMSQPFSNWLRQVRLAEMENKQKVLMLRANSVQQLAKTFLQKSQKEIKRSTKTQAKLAKLFREAQKTKIQKLLELKLKQFYLGCRRNRQSCLEFYKKLRHHNRTYMGHKIWKLQSSLMIGRAKQFFSFYPNIRRQRILLVFRIKNLQKYQQLRTTRQIFQAWRYENAKNQLSSERLKNGPEMAEFKFQHEHLKKMSELQSQQIAAKNQKIRLYQERLEQMDLQLVSQQLKLQKLRSSYETNIQETRIREMEFMQVINGLQNKFDRVSAQVDQMAIDEIKKQYKYTKSVFSSTETSRRF